MNDILELLELEDDEVEVTREMSSEEMRRNYKASKPVKKSVKVIPF